MSNLIKLLPSFLREIKEYKEIFSSIEEEFNAFRIQMDKALQESSVETATDYGLDRYEKMLNIANSSNDVIERRFKIKSKLINQLPFNKKWLDNKLKSLVGEGNYIIKIDESNYEVTVQVSYIFPNVVKELSESLRNELPANLVVNVNLFRTEEAEVYVGGILHIGKFKQIGGIT